MPFDVSGPCTRRGAGGDGAGFPCRPLCHRSGGNVPGRAPRGWDSPFPPPRGGGTHGWAAAARPGEMETPAGSSLSEPVAARLVPAAVGSWGAGGWAAAVSGDAGFCNLNWLNLVRAGLQPPGVTSQQFAGSPPALLPPGRLLLRGASSRESPAALLAEGLGTGSAGGRQGESALPGRGVGEWRARVRI